MRLRATLIESLKLLVPAAYNLKSTLPCQVYRKYLSCSPFGEMLELHTYGLFMGPSSLSHNSAPMLTQIPHLHYFFASCILLILNLC